MTTRLDQLEQETEQSRADLSRTLRELKSRMTPGQVLDDAIDYFHDGDVAQWFRICVDRPSTIRLRSHFLVSAWHG